MSYTTEKISGNKIKISFNIPAEAFDESIYKAYLKMRGRINVPGFRRGKAPRKLIETMFGEGVFYEEAFELIFPDVYSAAVREEKINPVDRPEVSTQQIGTGKELLFTAEVFVRPDVSLGEYKGVKIEKHMHPVTEEMIDARIEKDIEKATATIDVTDRAIEADDIVNLDYTGTIDGVKFEGGTAKAQTISIGSNTFIAGFEDQMIGMQTGEEKDLSVIFPEDYNAEELRGKGAVFHVKVNGVSRKVKPQLDDDFAADISAFDTFAEYKADIVRELTEQQVKNAETHLENELIQKVVDASDCDIPQAMIDDEIDVMLREMKMRMSYQGLRFEDYLKYTGQTEDQLREMYRPQAQNRVKTELVIEKIRKLENIEATQEDIEKMFVEQAKRTGRDVEEFKTSLNDSQKSYFSDAAAAQLAVDLIKNSADITLCDKDHDHDHNHAHELHS